MMAPEEIRTSRIKLVTLVLVAFVPIFIAYSAFFYFPDWGPKGTTNQGELIVPAIPGEMISSELLALQSWVLLQPVTTECDQDCVQMLYLSHQVVAGLGKDAHRVKRVVIMPARVSELFSAFLKSDHPDVRLIKADPQLLDQKNAMRPVLFLMDPNGNVLMYYSLDKAGKPMLKDLKHLLKVSNIG